MIALRTRIVVAAAMFLVISAMPAAADSDETVAPLANTADSIGPDVTPSPLDPTGEPTEGPSPDPSEEPSPDPSPDPSEEPSPDPSDEPSGEALAVGPEVQCAWLVPDMGLDPSDGLQPEQGDLSDDLPGMPSPMPCDLVDGMPTQAASTAVASVRPNAGDQPGTRLMAVWVALSPPADEAALERVAVRAVSAAGTDLITTDAQLVDCTSVTEPIAAGIRSGQISEAAGTGEGGLQSLCAGGEIAAAYATVAVSYLDACGPAAVEVRVGDDVEGAVTLLPFDVVCTQALATDFSGADWPALVPGAESIVRGDLDPSTTGAPTVTNRGNVPVAISVSFDPLCLLPGRTFCVGDFAVGLAPPRTGPSRVGPSPPGTQLIDVNAVLCPGEAAPLDLAVVAPANLERGEYRGSLRVVGVPAPPGSCSPLLSP